MAVRMQKPVVTGLLAFGATVAIALTMRWEAGDLMWGAWASSVTYGYVYAVVLLWCNPEEGDAGTGGDRGRFLVIMTFFTFIFGSFHYAQGIFLSMAFPITSLEGRPLLLYPLTAFAWYWGVVAATFLSRWHELREATEPSRELHRLLRPFQAILQMQILVFVFFFLSAVGLIRFAVYPVLVFYFFPFPIIGERLKAWFGKLEDRMNRIPPDEFPPPEA